MLHVLLGYCAGILLLRLLLQLLRLLQCSFQFHQACLLCNLPPEPCHFALTVNRNTSIHLYLLLGFDLKLMHYAFEGLEIALKSLRILNSHLAIGLRGCKPRF